MQISYTYTYIPFFLSLPPLLSSHPTKSSQRTQLGSLCYTETPQQLFYIWKWKWKSLPCVLLLVTPWIMQSMDFSRPEYWSGQPFSSPGDLPNPGIKPRLPTFQADSLPAEPQGKPILHMIVYIYICLCYFLHSFHSLLPRLSTSPFSISVSPFLPCKWVHHYCTKFFIFIFFWFKLSCILFLLLQIPF